MTSGNQVTAGGFVQPAGGGQALRFPGSLTATSADGEVKCLSGARRCRS
jgi:hypothetical protein